MERKGHFEKREILIKGNRQPNGDKIIRNREKDGDENKRNEI